MYGKLIPYALTGLFVAILAYGLHDMRVEILQSRHRSALQAQAGEMATKCEEAQKVTREVSNDLQTRLRALNRRYADAVGVRSQYCVYVHPAGTPSGSDAAAGNR